MSIINNLSHNANTQTSIISCLSNRSRQWGLGEDEIFHGYCRCTGIQGNLILIEFENDE